MMQIWIVAIALMLPSVYASSWDRLSIDSDEFLSIMQTDSGSITLQYQEGVFEDEEELFPVTEEEIDHAGIEEVSLSDTHVTIRVNGLPVVLQDVPATSWYAPYVRDVADRQLISGYRDVAGLPTGKFGPSDPVSVEQLAKLAVTAASIDTFFCGDPSSLQNTSAVDTWSEQYILCAEHEGWAIYADGSIDVTRPATRAEVLVTLLQALHIRIGPRSGTLFEDVTTSTEFGAAIETAAELGIISGYSDSMGNPTGYFGPKDMVNRAEVAKIFSLANQIL